MYTTLLEGVPASQGSAVVPFCMHVVAGALSDLCQKGRPDIRQDFGRWKMQEQMKTISWAAFCPALRGGVKELCIGVCKRG